MNVCKVRSSSRDVFSPIGTTDCHAGIFQTDFAVAIPTGKKTPEGEI